MSSSTNLFPISKNKNTVKLYFFLSKLKNIEFGCIAYKLIHSGLKKEDTVRAITKYMMFLCLIHLYPNLQLVPNKEIDKVWHQHILDTEKYISDCEMLFGHIIHHFPYFEDDKNLQIAFENTQHLLAQHFNINMLEDKYDANINPACKLNTDTNIQRPTINLPELSSLLS